MLFRRYASEWLFPNLFEEEVASATLYRDDVVPSFLNLIPSLSMLSTWFSRDQPLFFFPSTLQHPQNLNPSTSTSPHCKRTFPASAGTLPKPITYLTNTSRHKSTSTRLLSRALRSTKPTDKVLFGRRLGLFLPVVDITSTMALYRYNIFKATIASCH